MKILVAFIVFVLSSSYVLGGQATGRVTGYIAYSTGTDEIIFIKVENISGTPSCNDSQRFTMTVNNPRFKSTNSAALAAYMAQTQVTVKGLGTCNNFGNSEDLDYICLGNIPC